MKLSSCNYTYLVWFFYLNSGPEFPAVCASPSLPDEFVLTVPSAGSGSPTCLQGEIFPPSSLFSNVTFSVELTLRILFKVALQDLPGDSPYPAPLLVFFSHYPNRLKLPHHSLCLQMITTILFMACRSPALWRQLTHASQMPTPVPGTQQVLHRYVLCEDLG